jgi:hypothetical protein
VVRFPEKLREVSMRTHSTRNVDSRPSRRAGPEGDGRGRGEQLSLAFGPPGEVARESQEAADRRAWLAEAARAVLIVAVIFGGLLL